MKFGFVLSLLLLSVSAALKRASINLNFGPLQSL